MSACRILSTVLVLRYSPELVWPSVVSATTRPLVAASRSLPPSRPEFTALTAVAGRLRSVTTNHKEQRMGDCLLLWAEVGLSGTSTVWSAPVHTVCLMQSCESQIGTVVTPLPLGWLCLAAPWTAGCLAGYPSYCASPAAFAPSVFKITPMRHKLGSSPSYPQPCPPPTVFHAPASQNCLPGVGSCQSCVHLVHVEDRHRL